MKPLITAFGLKPLSKNVARYYIPHYASFPHLYFNSTLCVLPTKSVMFTREAWAEVDFWNLDSDAFLADDSLSFTDALSTSGNHWAYFDPFITIYRLAHSDLELKSNGKTKNDSHVLSILENMVRADCVWVSPIAQDRLKPVLKQFFSKSIIEDIHRKYLVLPYPSYYKVTATADPQPLRISSKKPLVFLWNHRLVANKNFKDFCSILLEFKRKYAEVSFTILFVCAEPEDTILKALPKELHENLRYVGYISDKQQYIQAISNANITIATSKLESFGNSVFDSIVSGVLLLNQDCNTALSTLIGSKYTWAKAELPDVIYAVYKSSKYRQEIHDYNLAGVRRIPNKKQAEALISSRVKELMQLKKEQSPSLASSKVLGKAYDFITKNACVKQELYKAIGWSQGKTPLNAHWAGYYYALRGLGVNVTKRNGITYYHVGKLENCKDTLKSNTTLW